MVSGGILWIDPKERGLFRDCWNQANSILQVQLLYVAHVKIVIMCLPQAGAKLSPDSLCSV